MDDRLRLAELLCARLCHDLGGLLGSLLGTLELLADEAGSNEAASIAVDTAAVLAQRLNLLRAAWSGGAAPLDLPHLQILAQGLAYRRIGVDVAGLTPGTVFSPVMGRLVLNVLVLAADALPRGGVLRLDGGAEDVLARIDGAGAGWPPGLAGVLADEVSAWDALRDPRTLQAPLTALLAREHGLTLTLLMTGGAAAAAPPLRLSMG